jgi:hypothetical protein
VLNIQRNLMYIRSMRIIILIAIVSGLIIAPAIPVVKALGTKGIKSYTEVQFITPDNADTQQIKHLVNMGKIVVIRGYVDNNVKIKLPVMTVSKKLVSKDIDPRHNIVVNEKDKDMGTIIIKPTYVFYIIYKDNTGVIKEFAILTHSLQKRIIEKVISEGELALDSITKARADTTSKYTSYSRPIDYYTTSNAYWIKKGEVHYTWVLNSNDELYTRYEIYELNQYDITTGKEYWRIDGYIDHNLGSYTATNSICGPYIHQRTVYINAGNELYKYGPKTTNSDETVHVNIGFSVSTSGGSVGVSYGWSWSNPGVSYAVSAYYSQHKVKWTESFRGPDYFWYPWYSEPTASAHNSYYAMPSAVFRTPVGNGISITKLESTWTIYTDHLSFRVVYLHIDRDAMTYSVYWTSLYYSSIF